MYVDARAVGILALEAWGLSRTIDGGDGEGSLTPSEEEKRALTNVVGYGWDQVVDAWVMYLENLYLATRR